MIIISSCMDRDDVGMGMRRMALLRALLLGPLIGALTIRMMLVE